MKTILAPLLLLPALVCAAPREVDRGNETGYTKAFEAKHPYTVSWSLSFPEPAYKGQEVDKTISVFVYDAETEECITRKLDLPWNGSLKVPEGGRHYLKVFTPSAWILRIEEQPPNPHEQVLKQLAKARRDAEDQEKSDKAHDETRAAIKRFGEESKARIKAAPPGPERDRVIKEEQEKLRELAKRLGVEDALSPVPEPKPSSVPGLPAGVEPAKKKAGPALPPGMTRGK